MFDIPTAMANVAEHQITMLPGPPAIYQTFLNHPDLDLAKLQSLRLAVTGAAAVPVELIERMKQELGFETVVTGYGLTESLRDRRRCAATTTPPRRSHHAPAGPSPASRCRVVDDDGAEVPRGEPGEIVVRGYNVMQEYFEDPEQTAEAIDADGWLHTGDIGTMDERGYLVITDRKKDMFITGGLQRLPRRDRAAAARSTRTIAQVAVIGVPDERMGEVGMAFVVPDRRDDAPIPTRSWPGPASTWPTSRCPATSASSRRCR